MGEVIIDINPKIYNLDVIYSAAYVLLDKYYILLDGDPKKNMKVTLTSKDPKGDISKIESEFHNQLITYAFYKEQSKKNAVLRQTMLQAALLSTEKPAESIVESNSSEEETEIMLPEDLKDADFLEDPEGIAIPWEEKYKKQNQSMKNKWKKKNKD